MDNKLKNLEPFFGSWYIDEPIGEGSFGTVFRIKRESYGKLYFAAMKVIEIPKSDTEIQQAYSEGLDDVSITSYFESIIKSIINEIDMMVLFKGNTNIVSYEDHQIIPNENGIGGTIIIRMELLKNLSTISSNHIMPREEVVKLGIDICRALETCHKNNVIHRDIKPENIFVNANGDYKLGDFGISRQLENTMSGLSKKGTYTYMAPEVYLGKDYNASVDVYSLGIVLYRLLNNNRAPFLPDFPNPITFNDKNRAQTQRMAGEPLPPLKDIPNELNAIILKACSFEPKDRYTSPEQMKKALVKARAAVPSQPEAPVTETPVAVAPSPADLLLNSEPSDSDEEGTVVQETEPDAAYGETSLLSEEDLMEPVPPYPQAENAVEPPLADGLYAQDVYYEDDTVLSQYNTAEYTYSETALLSEDDDSPAAQGIATPPASPAQSWAPADAPASAEKPYAQDVFYEDGTILPDDAPGPQGTTFFEDTMLLDDREQAADYNNGPEFADQNPPETSKSVPVPQTDSPLENVQTLPGIPTPKTKVTGNNTGNKKSRKKLIVVVSILAFLILSAIVGGILVYYDNMNIDDTPDNSEVGDNTEQNANWFDQYYDNNAYAGDFEFGPDDGGDYHVGFPVTLDGNTEYLVTFACPMSGYWQIYSVRYDDETSPIIKIYDRYQNLIAENYGNNNETGDFLAQTHFETGETYYFIISFNDTIVGQNTMDLNVWLLDPGY